MEWHVIIAVDADSNAAFRDWAIKKGSTVVVDVVTADSAQALPVLMNARKHVPLACLLSTLCPDLPEWGDVLATLIKAREAPTRVVIMAEGGADGVDSPLGRLETSTLRTLATIFEGKPGDDNQVQFDFEAIAQALWGEGEAMLAPPAPSPPGKPRRLLPPLLGEANPSPAAAAPPSPAQVPELALIPETSPPKRRGLFGFGRKQPSVAPVSAMPEESPPSEGGAGAWDNAPVAAVPSRVILPPSRLIVVMGGKGGVGKTTIVAAMLAAAAQLYGDAIGIDFDYLKPNLALHFWDLRTKLPSLKSVFDAIMVNREATNAENPDGEVHMIQEWILQLRQPMPGVLLIPGPDRALETVLPPEHVPPYILNWAMAQNPPVVICDTDPTIDEAAEAAILRAEQDGLIVLVTTPEIDAVAETDRLWRQITQGLGVSEDRLRLIINHRGSPKGHLSTKEILQVHLPRLELLAELPWIPRIAQTALSQHRPVTKWPRSVRWDRILAAATGRTADPLRERRRREWQRKMHQR